MLTVARHSALKAQHPNEHRRPIHYYFNLFQFIYYLIEILITLALPSQCREAAGSQGPAGAATIRRENSWNKQSSLSSASA